MSLGYAQSQLELMRTLERGDVAGFFYLSGAQEYIGRVSVRGHEGLDIAATAAKIGVPVEYDDVTVIEGRYVPGSTAEAGPAPRFDLNTEHPDIDVIFGHEVGHHFLCDELGIGHHFVKTAHEPTSEAFCEFFGRKMVDIDPVDDASLEREVKQRYGVPTDYEGYVEYLLLDAYARQINGGR
jgi:hypothetical protein